MAHPRLHGTPLASWHTPRHQDTPPGSRGRRGESRTHNPHRPPQKKDAQKTRGGSDGRKSRVCYKNLKKTALAFFLKFFNGKLFRPSKPHHKFAHLLFWGSGWGRQKNVIFFILFLIFTYYHSFSLIISHVYILFLIFTYLFFTFFFYQSNVILRGWKDEGGAEAGRRGERK